MNYFLCNRRWLYGIVFFSWMCTATQAADESVLSLYQDFLLQNPTLNRAKVEGFIRSVSNQEELLLALKSEMTGTEETNTRKNKYNASLFLGTLAIIGNDDVRINAIDSLIEFCVNPSLITASLGMLEAGSASTTNEMLDALGEIGNETAIACLVEASRQDFWREKALPAGNQKWPEEDIDSLVRTAFGNVYFLQWNCTEALRRVIEVRLMKPQSLCDENLKRDLARYDEGSLPLNALIYLRLREGYRFPFFRHPAVDIYLSRQSSIPQWASFR